VDCASTAAAQISDEAADAAVTAGAGAGRRCMRGGRNAAAMPLSTHTICARRCRRQRAGQTVDQFCTEVNSSATSVFISHSRACRRSAPIMHGCTLPVRSLHRCRQATAATAATACA